jgi:hypothetical protein
MAAVLCGAACASRTPHSDVSIPGVIGAPPGVVTGTEHVENVSVDPAAAGRIRGLGQQLATQDSRIAAHAERNRCRPGRRPEPAGVWRRAPPIAASAPAPQNGRSRPCRRRHLPIRWRPSACRSLFRWGAGSFSRASGSATACCLPPRQHTSCDRGIRQAASDLGDGADREWHPIRACLDAQHRIARLERMLAAEVAAAP